MLPLFLSFSNNLKSKNRLLASGHFITKEEVERAIKEKKERLHLEGQKNHVSSNVLDTNGNRVTANKELEGTIE